MSRSQFNNKNDSYALLCFIIIFYYYKREQSSVEWVDLRVYNIAYYTENIPSSLMHECVDIRNEILLY